MRKGTKVILVDGSWSIQVEDGQLKSAGDIVKGFTPNFIKYEIVETDLKLPFVSHGIEGKWNDTIIKNIATGKLIFTQMRFIREVKPIAVNFLTAFNQTKRVKPVIPYSKYSSHDCYLKPIEWLEDMCLSIDELNGMWLIEE
ncbi:MAG TPA: hypothetical protein VIK78_14465 [Ruminiclostridium sp.]